MKTNISSFLIGIIFAIGLGLGGMTQPQNIISFLDIFAPDWNPSLLFVMGAAFVTHAILYRLIRRRAHPLFSTQWHIPEKTKLTKALMIGSALFGLGWGLAGYCPAPAITALASGSMKAILFVIAMLAGMLVFNIFQKYFKIEK